MEVGQRVPSKKFMDIATLVDHEAMTHIATFGCVKNMDPFALHMLKHSEHPVLRFRRHWMRQTAIRQHLEAESNQKRINDHTARFEHRPKANMRKAATIDSQLFAEMLHYNGEPVSQFERQLRREAPKIFGK